MKQFYFQIEQKQLPVSMIMGKYACKTARTRDNYALLAGANHQLAMGFSLLGEKSAHFQKVDCFVCQSPKGLALRSSKRACKIAG